MSRYVPLYIPVLCPRLLRIIFSITSRLSTTKELQPLAKNEVTECVHKWNIWVKTFIDSNVNTLLNNITRIKVLHEIRDAAFKIGM